MKYSVSFSNTHCTMHVKTIKYVFLIKNYTGDYKT